MEIQCLGTKCCLVLDVDFQQQGLVISDYQNKKSSINTIIFGLLLSLITNKP